MIQLAPVPRYRQIANIIRQRIESGELQPERPIPSEAQIMQEFGVARATARHAAGLLRDEGLVVRGSRAWHLRAQARGLAHGWLSRWHSPCPGFGMTPSALARRRPAPQRPRAGPDRASHFGVLANAGPNARACQCARTEKPVSTVDAELEIAEPSVQGSDLEVTAAREARVGDMTVRRLLPLRLRRSVGAWCFVDHYGPMSVDGVQACGCRRTRTLGCRP